MVPEWIQVFGSLSPILLLVSTGVIIFGIYRLKGFMASRDVEHEEEERKRVEPLKQLNQKIANAKSKPQTLA